MFDLYWVAKFNDGSYLLQYPEPFISDKETPFKEVLDRQDDLVQFILFNRLNKVCYSANLQDGCLSSTQEGDELLPPREDMLHKSDYKYRLIYFREIERTFGSNLTELGKPKVLFFLGLQYTDEDNKNHKTIMRIDSKGRWTLR